MGYLTWALYLGTVPGHCCLKWEQAEEAPGGVQSLKTFSLRFTAANHQMENEKMQRGTWAIRQ